MEASFNFNNKMMARATLEYTKANNLLPKEQYKSRKDHQAIAQANNKWLLCDLNYLQRRLILLCSNNTKSYYNRIVYLIASMVIQQVGMPRLPVIWIFKIIQEMEYYIRTNFKNSKITIYRRDLDKPY